MHPKEYLNDCTELLGMAMKFDQPLDALVGQFFNQSRRAGMRERDSIASVVYMVMRRRYLCEHLAQTGPGTLMRRIALVGFALSHNWPSGTQWNWPHYLAPALSPEETAWLDHAMHRLSTPSPELPTQALHNLPEWLHNVLQPLLGTNLPALCQALQEPAALDVRVNINKAKRATVHKHLQTAGITTTETPYSPWGLRFKERTKVSKLPDFDQGVLEVQDEGSQLIALLTEAKRNETVVDFCAGGGGKTLAMGAMMRNTGRLYAYDTSAQRLAGLQPRLQKSGLHHVVPMVIANESDPRLALMHRKADRVLVDAPCSGTGTLRRSPALKWRLTPERIAQLVVLQHTILNAAAQLVAPGGRLVYATCSLLQAENEAIAEHFSRTAHDFVALPVLDILQRQKIDQAAQVCSQNPMGLYLRLWPHQVACDGFFAAVWQRK